MNSENIFVTANVDLAAYLMLNGLPYLDAEVGYDEIRGKKIALLRFRDEKGVARDLERLFMTSSEKRFRDLIKYLLRQVHQTVR